MSSSPERVNLRIDGKTYQAAAGAVVMDVAREQKLPITGLCSSRHLRPYGSCRLCLVQIEGQRALAAACTTPVRDGMVVTTRTPEIDRTRRVLLELYLSQSSSPELAALAQEYGADRNRFGAARHQRRASQVDHSSPYFAFDPSRCVLCARCVRACDEVQGQFVLHLGGRGFGSAVRTGNGSFKDSACVTCGTCVRECPTGALSDKSLATSPTPERTVRTTCTYCGVGCQFHAEVADGRIVRMRPDEDSPVNAGHACVKGRYAFDYVSSPDRLKRPLIRTNPKSDCDGEARWREGSWDEVIKLIASRFGQLIQQYGPDAIGCISSSRGTSEENYLLQKFSRACLGNNHIDNCARVCHSSTVAGMQEVFGTGAATNSLKDIALARLIMIVGCNPTEAHPVVGARIKQAMRRGAKLIVIDPRRIELARYADVHLQLRPGSNVAVLNGLAHVILREKLADKAFIAQRTENFDAFAQAVETYTPERVAEISGVAPELLEKAARLYAQSGASMCCHGLGVTEHRSGSFGVMALSNLAILTGNVGRPGTGINPLRGQNNVQGACDMGALPTSLTAGQKYSDPAVRQRYESRWGRPLPQTTGWRIPDMYEAACGGRLRGMWIMGYDPAQSDSNQKLVRQALGQLDFLVVSDLFPNQTTQFADVVLPAAGGLEKEGTFTNGERRIQRVRTVVEPPGEARADWQVICAIASAMGYPMDYASPSQIMDEIAELTPSMAGVSYERLEGEGLQWPVPDRTHPGTSIMHGERFSRGLARFAAVEYLPPGEVADDQYPFVLVTGRVLQHYNAGTMTRRTQLTRVVDRDFIEIHPEDAASLSLKDGELARITSRSGSVTLSVRISPRVAIGNLFSSFHFPQALVNALTSGSADILTRCPEYKVMAVRVERAQQP